MIIAYVLFISVLFVLSLCRAAVCARNGRDE
jgi:hypothetical protein